MNTIFGNKWHCDVKHLLVAINNVETGHIIGSAFYFRIDAIVTHLFVLRSLPIEYIPPYYNHSNGIVIVVSSSTRSLYVKLPSTLWLKIFKIKRKHTKEGLLIFRFL